MKKGNELMDSIEKLIGDCDYFKKLNNDTLYKWNLNDMEQKKIDFIFSEIDKLARMHRPVLIQIRNAIRLCPAYVTVEIPLGY